MSLLQTTCRILSTVLLSRLILFVDEIIGDHHCGFQLKRSTTDKIFCIHQMLEKEMGVRWDIVSFIYSLEESP
jgi:hypothetical protein